MIPGVHLLMKMLPLEMSYKSAARVDGLWIWPNCLQAHLKRSSHVDKLDYTRQISGLGSTIHGVRTSLVSPSNRAGHPSLTRTAQTCNSSQQMKTGQLVPSNSAVRLSCAVPQHSSLYPCRTALALVCTRPHPWALPCTSH